MLVARRPLGVLLQAAGSLAGSLEGPVGGWTRSAGERRDDVRRYRVGGWQISLLHNATRGGRHLAQAGGRWRGDVGSGNGACPKAALLATYSERHLFRGKPRESGGAVLEFQNRAGDETGFDRATD